MEHETDSRNKNWAQKSKKKTDGRHREANQGEKNTNAKASKHTLQHIIVKSIDKNALLFVNLSSKLVKSYQSQAQIHIKFSFWGDQSMVY